MIVERKDPAATADFYIFSRFSPRQTNLLLIAGNGSTGIVLSRVTMNGVECLSFRARSRSNILLYLRSMERRSVRKSIFGFKTSCMRSRIQPVSAIAVIPHESDQ